MEASARAVLIGLVSAAIVGGVLAALAPRLPSEEPLCGPTSLVALMKHVGIHTDPRQVIERFGRQTNPVSFESLRFVGAQSGLTLRGRRLSLTDLRREKPCGILHLDGRHFAVLVGYTDRGVVLMDPVRPGVCRRVLMSYACLRSRWQGAILCVDAEHGAR